MSKDPNLPLLVRAAELLGPMLKDLVFVGGCATGQLITDSGAALVRATTDVDVIVEISSRNEYYALEKDLRQLGFREAKGEGVPVCRWMHEQLLLDVMPTDETILGFSNRWYKPAMRYSQELYLTENICIRLITAPYFIATKLEAFHGRGKDDYWTSHDLEDIVNIVDGRIELLSEIKNAESDVRSYLATEFANLLNDDIFLQNISGFVLPDLASQQRVPDILKCLKLISNMGK